MKDRVLQLPNRIKARAASLGRALADRWRKAVFLVSLSLATLMLVSLLGMEVTSRPQFCGSCHIMEPYYKSWQSSTHKNVACVECHIPPGITSEFRKKYEALSMVTSYFTGTYGTNPWTEIDDAACLRCHERRLLAGKEVFHSVLFNHTPHLTEMRREKKLRCTSCHSQIVQGSHIAVTESTCFLCHFKGQQINQGTGQCTLCHEIPDKQITKANLSFDHGDVKRFNMECASCHSNVVQGNGEVPRERCATCHNDPPRLQRYDETEYMHQTHVTDHKIECTNCHMEIRHKTGHDVEAASTTCNTCHRDGHSPTRDLYAGIGGKGVAPMPSAMFQAGIHCEGCHFQPQDKFGSQVAKASEVSCMSCHGPRYSKTLGRWKTLVDGRLGQAKNEWLQARRVLSDSVESQPLADAFENLQLVDRGVGTHNVEYSLALIDASHDMINQAREQRGLKPLAKRWTAAPFESACFRCHRGIEEQSGRMFGLAFVHKPHLMSGFQCATCHRPHEERTSKEIVRFGREGCANCHHARQQENVSYCTKCHGDLFTRKVSFKGKQFDHAMHVKDMSQKCADCHRIGGQIKRGPNLNACASCHPDGWK
ncbi:MAG TPA: cytochrome c3 family protein [Blastocatellia bacterium]|nr:cytochrome c3 family protein [Blastocatellia bacterium]